MRVAQDVSPRTAPRTSASGAVSSSVTDLGGRRIVLAEIGPSGKLGALSLRDSERLAAAVGTALDHRIPLVGVVASTGALRSDGVSASHGLGLVARALVRASGVVPTIAVVAGPSVSGHALLLGLVDHVVMTRDAFAYVNGPHLVREYTGDAVSSQRLGGSGVHDRQSGLASLVVEDLDNALDAVAELLGFLPDHTDVLPPRWPTIDPTDRPTPEAGDRLPASVSGSYDVRDIVRAIVDDGALLELHPGWAPNLVTGLATLGGAPVGLIANQPLSIAGTLDIPASQKGARFVTWCDAFNLPLVTLVDTPGFFPGKDLEWRGMIRHGAQLAFAYARATVPRVCVTLRKSYGGAYIVMDSKHLGNDLALAWPTAEIAVMGAKGAVEILHRREAPEVRSQLERDYEDRLLNPYVAADRGSIDAVIDPADTRRVLIEALSTLQHKRERFPARAHDNTPL